MTVPLLPNPDNGPHDHPAGEAGARPHDEEPKRSEGRQKPQIATEEECLAVLSRLPGLVTLRMLTTGQVNTIRGVYSEILRHHRQKRATNDGGGGVDDALVDMLARHPELAHLLEPMLSAEQIAAILARG